MIGRGWVTVAAALVATACSATRANNLPPEEDASADASDSATFDSLAGANDGTSGEVGYFCEPPAAATTVDDGGGGCVPRPGIYGNGGDACSSSEYGVTCNDYLRAMVPATLQCQAVGIPTPPGVTFFCCPCVPSADD